MIRRFCSCCDIQQLDVGYLVLAIDASQESIMNIAIRGAEVYCYGCLQKGCYGRDECRNTKRRLGH